MWADVSGDVNYHFIPYIQLHEFEGLLFNDRTVFFEQIPNGDIIDVEYLDKTFANYSNPEMINNTKATSPSHRLEKIIRGYNKVVHGDILAEAIGMERLLAKSPRFKNWVKKMVSI